MITTKRTAPKITNKEWHIIRTGLSLHVYDGIEHIATLDDNSENEANAILIIAAPKLYKYAKEFLASGSNLIRANDALLALQEAISEAEGT